MYRSVRYSESPLYNVNVACLYIDLVQEQPRKEKESI